MQRTKSLVVFGQDITPKAASSSCMQPKKKREEFVTISIISYNLEDFAFKELSFCRDKCCLKKD